MALKTLKEQLEEVQTAISALLTGAESVSIDGINYKMTSLDMLTKREELLYARIAKQESSSRKRIYPNFNTGNEE